jgi:hypothetical protein
MTHPPGDLRTRLQAGTARRDITPAWPVLQGGYGQRQTPSDGVLDRIFTKALYLEHPSGRVLLITADLICIPGPLGNAVRAGVAARTGLDPAHVCICASHTHSAPVPWDPAGTAAGIAAWIPGLIDAMTDVGCAAVADTRAVRMRTGVGRFDLLHNRWTRGRPNTVDPRVPVVVLERTDDTRPAAVLFGMGCHPVTLGWDSLGISGDFPGRAQTRIEEALGASCALFFNTTEGNVIPATSPDRDALDPRGYCGGTVAETDCMADALAQVVCAVARAAAPVDEPALGAAMTRVAVQAAGCDLDDRSAHARLTAARQSLAGALGADFEARVPARALWAAASAEVFAALPGEVLVQVGAAWRDRVGSDEAFVIALANAHYRYLPLAAQFAESDAAEHYETVTAGLTQDAVDRALDAALELAHSLRAGTRP